MGPNLFHREGRQPTIDYTGKHACVAARAQKRVRRTVAASGHEHSESAALPIRTTPLLNSISGWQG